MSGGDPLSESDSDESHDFIDPPPPLEEALGYKEDSIEFRRFMVDQSYGLSVF
jgi:hypothetical protein